MLSNDEASGFWGPRVFLSDGPARQPVTSQVAYWAEGVDPGEPVTILVKGLSELVEGVQKAACIQAIFEKGWQRIPMAAPMDPTHLQPLIRGLLDTLKIHVQSLRKNIQTAVECNQQNPQNPLTHVLGRNAAQHSHGCEMGWTNPGGGADKSRRVRQASHEPHPGQPPSEV